MELLFNNARKVYLGKQLQSVILRRKKFWGENRSKINGREKLTY